MKSVYLLIIAAGIVQACNSSEGRNENQSPKGDAIPVGVMALLKEESSPVIQTSGLFTTDDETNLAFKTGGIIEKIYVERRGCHSQGTIAGHDRPYRN